MNFARHRRPSGAPPRSTTRVHRLGVPGGEAAPLQSDQLLGRALIAAVAVSCTLACEDPEGGAEIARRVSPATSPPPPAAPSIAELAPGDTLLGLRVDSLDVAADPVEPPGWIGRVDFSGEVELAGQYRPHPEFPELDEPCFFVDDSTAARLPRFPNDVRRSWFCFSNPEEAEARLGPRGSSRAARIVIDRFHYLYSHTDVYNRARLARAVTEGANP